MKHTSEEKSALKLASKKKTKLGVILFIVYSLVYAGFVTIGVTNNELMGHIMPGGQNLAVIYGFGLIVFAIILGLIYNAICTAYENKIPEEDRP